MMTLNLRGLTSVLNCRLAVVVLAVGLAGCASMGGGGASNPAVGTWALIVESPLGTVPQTMILNEDMSGTIIVTEPLEMTLRFSNAIVDGQSLSFVFSGEILGQEFTSGFQGTVDGDAITGEYVTEAGNVAFTGTRN